MATNYSSLIVKDALVGNLISQIEDLNRRVRALERGHPGPPGTGVGRLAFYNTDGMIDASLVGVMVPTSTANVSSTPTLAQLEEEFGSASLGDGVRGLIDDNAGGTLWACFVVNGKWGVASLTLRA